MPMGHLIMYRNGNWVCRCEAPLYVDWAFGVPVITGELSIENAVSSSWRLICEGGHRIMVANELSDNQAADNYPPPTTLQLVQRLASHDDEVAWREDQIAKLADCTFSSGIISDRPGQ